MANNPHVLDNLNPITVDNARDYQARSARKRHENCVRRNILKDSIIEILNGKMDIPQVMREQAESLGIKFKAKDKFGKFLMATLIQDGLKKKNIKGIVALAQMAGMTHDQSDEGLGGADNPINTVQSVSMDPSRVREIYEELDKEC